MQLIAMVTMLIDHIGIVFFPDQDVWRIVGRLAFPLYAYALVQGYRHTRSIKRYLFRLVVIGAVSQVPYMLALKLFKVNVVGSLLVCLAALFLIDRAGSRAGAVAIVLASAALLEAVPFDYGSYALFLVLVFRYCSPHQTVLYHLLLNFAYVFYKGWALQLYSIAATAMFAYAPRAYGVLEKIRIPRWFWRSFYPAHLIVLAVARLVVSGEIETFFPRHS
jgi:hypothetical protein